MKKITLLLFVLFSFTGLNAQVSGYTFAQTSGTYTSISGGTVLGVATNDDTNFNALEIGFTFRYNGTNFTQLSVNSNGFVALGATAVSSYLALSGGTSNNVIAAFNADLRGNANGELSYLTEGTAPNRVLTIQWKSYNSYTFSTTQGPDDYNFQIKLFETSNVVSIIYGSILQNEISRVIQVGLRGNTNVDFKNRTTATDWSATTAGTTNTDNCTLTTAIVPASGLTYTFTPPTCEAPTALTATAVTTNSATVSWLASSSAPSNGYEYVLATSAGVPTGTGVPISALTNDFTGLTENTIYYFYVRSNCGGTFSPWSLAFVFATNCNATSVPYSVNFENATVPALPNCTSQQNAGTGNLWQVAANPGYGFTTNALRYTYNSTNAANVWFYTQGINLVAGTSYTISFDYGSTGTTFPERLKVAYGTNANAAAMTNSIADFGNVTNALPLNSITQITPTTTGVYYFGFNAYSLQDQFYLLVDNINIIESPACSAPINVVASNVVFNGATINWSTIASATNYEYVNDNTMSNPTAAGTSINGTTINFNNLTPVTQYYFHIRTNCSGTYSDWTTITYTTPATPPANDECSGAIQLTVNSDLNCGVSTPGTVNAATASNVDATACFGTENNDVWFSFVASNVSHRIQLNNVSNFTDMFHSLWTGNCTALTLVPNSCSDANTSNPTALTVGQTYYVRVNTYGATASTATFDVCVGTPPAPPANDECANATVLPFNDATCDGTNNNGTNESATDSGVASASCFVYGQNDVWFSVVVPVGVATIDVSTDFTGGTLVDTEIALYSGACGSLTEVACDQDGGTTTLSNGSSYNSLITNAAVTGGNTYYVRVSGYSAANTGTFCLKAATNTLGNSNFDNASFSFYPNPVKDFLNLDYSETITNVSVFNLLGQQVKTMSLNTTSGRIDFSNLASGAYLVKVISLNGEKMIKVIKE